MKFELTNTQPHLLVRRLADQLGVATANDCVEELLEIPKTHGDGIITGFDFNNGIGILILYCTLYEDWEMVLQPQASALQFNFNLKGEMRHFLNNNEIQYQLLPLQGTITANPKGKPETFLLPAHTELIFTHLMIDRAAYLNRTDCLINQMPSELAAIFSDVEAEKVFFYQGFYSLAIAEVIRKIVQDKNEGIVRSTRIESKTLELLSRQIKQFNDDLQLPQRQVILRESDITKIETARDLLIKNLRNAPTIEELAKQVGVNRQKLKSGFKLIFDTTISNYLRDERLETASLLLLSGKSIAEAAQAVGYINQSHFSKRFKEKYSVLPKDYLKTVRSKVKMND